MITNFEGFSARITKTDMQLIDFLSNVLSKTPKEHPIGANDLLRSCVSLKAFYEYKNVITPYKIRKCINYLRRTGRLPVLANTKGYYTSYQENEIQRAVQSLEERAAAINAAAEGLKKFLTAQAKYSQYLNKEKW